MSPNNTVTPSQWRLLHQRRFAPFFVAQLAGAFNDNLYKQILVLLLSFHATEYGNLPVGIMGSLAGGIFILPFVLFSGVAGQLSDRFDKSQVIRAVKLAEILIMVLASLGLAFHSLWLLMLVLFLMGCHSAFFSPAKYSLLPRVLSPDELVGGNGLLEMGTFVSIILGGLLAGTLLAHTTEASWLSLALMAVAVLGWAASRFVPPTTPADPTIPIRFNPWQSTRVTLLHVLQQPLLAIALLAISWFWFFGAVFLAQLPALVQLQWHGTETSVSLVLGLFAIGVGLGSVSCERLGGRHLDIGLVPLGALGMSVFALDFSWAAQQPFATGTYADWQQCLHHPDSWRALADVALLGFSGGVFSVPLYAYVQTKADPTEQSRVIAANNVLNALFMVASAIFGVALAGAGLSPAMLIAVCALLNVGVLGLLCWHQPQFYLATRRRLISVFAKNE